MSTLTEVRSAIATALKGVEGLQGYEYMPAQVNPPAAAVAPDGIDYDVTFEHSATYRVPVLLLLSLGDWQSSQELLDSVISHDGAAVAAINAIEDFDCRVVAMTDYGQVTFQQTEYLSARLMVEVFT